MAFRKAAAVAIASLVAVTGLASTASANAGSRTSTRAANATEGCPSGAVCIYPQDAGWNGGQPSDTYYSYGYHNLSNQFGTHRIFNNQTGGATMRTCTGSNGTGCQGYLTAGTFEDVDLTPINSITLEP